MKQKFSKQFFHVTICFVLMFMFVSSAEAWYYNDDPTNHDGSTEEKAYLINDVENLKLLRDRVNSFEEKGKYYKLTADLDLTSEEDWEPIGYGFTTLANGTTYSSGRFSGHFDGASHTITVSFDRTVRDTNSARSDAGLFGIIEGTDKSVGASKETFASVKNLNVRGTVKALALTNGAGTAVAGGIAKSANESSIIENCTFSGDVSAVNEGSGYAWAGGIVVEANSISVSKIESCVVKYGSSISAVSKIDSDNSFAGGIAGSSGLYPIEGCTARARILNAQHRGGITGEADSNVILDNKYSGALWGIGASSYGSGNDKGCTYDPISIDILTKPLSPATCTVDQRYETTLEASEVKNVKWEVTGGDLPEKITLSSSGVLSGVPVSADVYRFEVKVSITGFNIEDKTTYELTVKDKEQTPNTPNTPEEKETSSGGGGGGCNAGLGLSAVMLCAAALLKKR